MPAQPPVHVSKLVQFRLKFLAFGLLVMAITAAAFINALTSTLALSQPEFVLSVAPENATAIAFLNEAKMAGLSETGAAENVNRSARRALQSQSLGAAALRQLGFVANATGQQDKGSRLMTLSARLSRRDVGTQLWLVESAVQSGDIPRALRHYDQSLRIFPATSQVLYPILTVAAESPEIATPLIKILVQRPVWRQGFMAALIDSSPSTALNLMSAMKARGFKEDADLVKQLVRTAATQNKNAVAFAAYEQWAPRPAQATIVKNYRFSRDDLLPPLDWQYSDPIGIELFHGSTGTDSTGLTIISTKLEATEVASQKLNLIAGRYRLTAQLGIVPPTGNLIPSFQLKCVNAANTLITSMNATAATSEIMFSVPASDCSYQVLSISQKSRPSDTEEAIRIDAAMIASMR